MPLSASSLLSSAKQVAGLTEYPPVAFSFKVSFLLGGGKVDTSFQEVSGISSEFESEPIEEGGSNEHVHMVPKAVKHSNLVLKRGIAAMTSPLVLWCDAVLCTDLNVPIVPQMVFVYLQDENQLPVRCWSFDGAYPYKWSVDPFNSTKNDVAIETIELKYKSSIRLL